jgi:hypothetical protein
MRQAVFQIGQKMIRAPNMTLADEPARHEFGIRIERNPCPNIARAFGFHFRRTVFFLRANEAPNLVALNPFLRRLRNTLSWYSEQARPSLHFAPVWNTLTT